MSNENALIEWTGLGIKHIATPEGNAICLPGAITPVPTAIWALSRDWFKDLIVTSTAGIDKKDLDHGRFIEHHVKVSVEEIPEKKGPGGKVVKEASTGTVVEAKDLADLEDSEARKIIDKIVDPLILEGYLANDALDSKASLKGAIERRLKVVEEKGKRK